MGLGLLIGKEAALAPTGHFLGQCFCPCSDIITERPCLDLDPSATRWPCLVVMGCRQPRASACRPGSCWPSGAAFSAPNHRFSKDSATLGHFSSCRISPTQKSFLPTIVPLRKYSSKVSLLLYVTLAKKQKRQKVKENVISHPNSDRFSQ